MLDPKRRWLAALHAFYCLKNLPVCLFHDKSRQTKTMQLNTSVSCVKCLTHNAIANFVKNIEKLSFCSLKKMITPQIYMLCFVLINSVLLNLLLCLGLVTKRSNTKDRFNT